MIRRVLLTLGLASLLGSGCGSKALSKTPSGGGPCQKDSDCTISGQVCLDIGCADPEAGLAVQVQPSSRSGLLTQEFGSVDLSKGTLDLALGAAGGFSFTSDVLPLNVSLTGHSLVIPDVAESAQGTVSVTGDTIQVPQGSYTVVANPADGNAPPTVATADLTKSGALAVVPLKFFQASQLTALHGFLSSGILNGDGSGQYAFDVQAFGAGLDGVPLSQPSAVNPGNLFTFQLAVAPLAPQAGSSITLVVSPTTGPGPRVSFTRTLASLQQENQQTAGVRLNLGDSLVQKVVQGTVTDEANQPLSGATVTLDGAAPENAQSDFSYHSNSVITDGTGTFSLPALFDRDRLIQYSVLVVPPQGSHLASFRSPKQAIPDTLVYPNVAVPKASAVAGRVLDDKGQPVLGATVRAEPVNAGGDVPLQAVETTTDASGTYTLELTPGTYHLTYKPPFELNLPFNARTFTIASDTQLPDLQFSRATVVTGTVRGPDGSSVDGAVVRLYRVAQQGDGPAARSTLLATGKVVSGGTFSLTVPRR